MTHLVRDCGHSAEELSSSKAARVIQVKVTVTWFVGIHVPTELSSWVEREPTHVIHGHRTVLIRRMLVLWCVSGLIAVRGPLR